MSPLSQTLGKEGTFQPASVLQMYLKISSLNIGPCLKGLCWDKSGTL